LEAAQGSPASGKMVIVISLHGSHGSWSIPNVTKYILEQIGGGAEIPVLLMGDFNIKGVKQFETDNHIFMNMDENYYKVGDRPPIPPKNTAFNLKGETIRDSVAWDRKYRNNPDNIYIGNPRGSEKIRRLSHQVYRPSDVLHRYIRLRPYYISSETSDHLPVTGSFYLV